MSNDPALSSILSKLILFDSIVLDWHSNYLMSSELQFGFKVKSSINMRSMDLKESIVNNSSIFCTFLYATKAIDRVKYCKLLNLLIECKLPALDIRVLILILETWCAFLRMVFDYYCLIIF